EVFAEQLRHLATLAGTLHVALQVMPLRPGVIAPPGGPFTILRFSEPDLADVVYVEQLGSALYLDRAEQVERYTELMNRLSIASLTPQASQTFLQDLAADA
ncbi:MAG TPA: Scr1 family TA system antitoxin-like transcriptional regulator, partial [Kineosporiaceae bacterium]